MQTIDVDELLSRGVATFVDPSGAFKNKLLTEPQSVIIKLGVDPTRPDIHLGHAVILRKLRQFQDLGAKVVFLVGDVTALIGDPSGKSKVRPEISMQEVRANMETFKQQVGKILRTDPEVFSWTTNSEWFVGISDIEVDPNTEILIDGKPQDPKSFIAKAVVYENTRFQKTQLGHTKDIVGVTLLNMLAILRRITFARLIERDMFQERIKAGEQLYMHEMLYPVLQGTDSLAIARIYGTCDLEIGGTDQTFNMLMGRDVLRASGLPEQAVMALDILPGLDGKEKMSKSLDNYVAITDAPSEMFGKIMSIPDDVIVAYYKLATFTPLDEIERIENDLRSGTKNPRDIKMGLAHQIVEIYHGPKEAERAERDFIETFSRGGIPEHIPVIQIAADTKLADALVAHGVVASKTEFNRLEKAGAIKEIENGVYRIGKHRFIKLERV